MEFRIGSTHGRMQTGAVRVAHNCGMEWWGGLLWLGLDAALGRLVGSFSAAFYREVLVL